MYTEKLLSDEELAVKFRNEHAEQFSVLVRMHLSFVLDLNTDDNECFPEKTKLRKWTLVPFMKKTKCKNGTEGAPLSKENVTQLRLLINYLENEENIQQEGIFRKTGSLTRQQELRNRLASNTVELTAGYFSVHDCASVFKGLLAELSDPLLTESHYPVYCQISELCLSQEKPLLEDKLLEALQLLLLLLPEENKNLLKEILNLLNLTSNYENINRMSADNLATLFTPHLFCPRRLSPEQLHVNSQSLYGILSFMIKRAAYMFKLPEKLVIDFRAKYGQHRVLSPVMDESVSDQYAAKTVFTFVNQELTAKENEANPTETALAQLYAHIQSLPESSKKRKLVKQFNKENGHGTPLQVVRSSVPKSNKSFGDSIKKHIFHKKIAKSMKTHLKGTVPENGSSPQSLVARTKLFCTKCDSNSDVSNDESSPKKLKKYNDTCDLNDRDPSTPRISEEGCCITSTPACVLRGEVFTPECQGRTSMSPITRSTQRMSRAMQETMMTPRSRKPVLLVSGTNINALPEMGHVENIMDSLTEEPTETVEEKLDFDIKIKKSKSEGDVLQARDDQLFVLNNTDPPDSLMSTFKEYLNSRSMFTIDSPQDLSFSSRTDDFNSDINNFSDDKMSESLRNCLDGNDPEDCSDSPKQLVLKPKTFDQNGQPIVFETSF